MLGKLLKHELVATGKILLPINLLLFCVSLLGKLLITFISMPKNASPNLAAFIMLVVFLVIYILILIALSVVTTIYLIVRYYKSMFSREGYLTLTLPVSNTTIFLSKIMISVIWFFITFINTIFSVVILIQAMVTKADSSITNAMINKELFSTFGFHTHTLVLYLIFFSIISSIYSVLFMFTCINIGQLFSKHRILAAALTYVVISFIMQIVYFVFYFAQLFTSLQSQSLDYAFDSSYYFKLMSFSLIIYVVISIIFYIISVLILKKKVNIE